MHLAADRFTVTGLPRNAVAARRRNDVKMHIAITKVAKTYGARARPVRFQLWHSSIDKGGHLFNRHRNVMLHREAKRALQESVRRVASIALVHETLSMSVDEHVDIDEVIDRLIPIMGDVAPAEGAGTVTVVRRGDVGLLDADRAMPLVMVVTELIQNAIEHAYGPGESGTVELLAHRSTRMLEVTVRDDGAGLPPGFTLDGSDRLGLQIVQTLVTSELGGELRLTTWDGGTDAVVQVPLQPA